LDYAPCFPLQAHPMQETPLSRCSSGPANGTSSTWHRCWRYSFSTLPLPARATGVPLYRGGVPGASSELL